MARAPTDFEPQYEARLQESPILWRAIVAAGGTAILAERLGIRAPSIYRWSQIPPLRVLAVEAITGISRHELRPDLYPRRAPVVEVKSIEEVKTARANRKIAAAEAKLNEAKAELEAVRSKRSRKVA